MDRPIPAFYCCYLLRSTVRHQSLYVGSTPNPIRRLKQHNGDTKGGAVRTSKQNLRPWEMTCLVTGFPSKIAALQFEWAWQNTHQTRHIAPEERITQTVSRAKPSPRAGKTRRRPGRPRMSLTDKLANLKILLNAKSFQRWPLRVRFYASDVYKFWQRTKSQTLLVDKRDIQVSLEDTTTLPLQSDFQETVQSLAESTVARGIQALDVTYGYMKPSLENSIDATASTSITCVICKSDLDASKDQIIVCPSACRSSFHSSCLARSFLQQRARPDAILPLDGDCPKCHTKLNWSELILDLSLRIRGDKETTALFKQRRKAKANAADSASIVADAAQALAEEDDGTEVEAEDDLDETGFRLLTETPEIASDDEWKAIDDDDDNTTKPSTAPKRRTKMKNKSPAKSSSRVVQDSDWEDAEVLE